MTILGSELKPLAALIPSPCFNFRVNSSVNFELDLTTNLQMKSGCSLDSKWWYPLGSVKRNNRIVTSIPNSLFLTICNRFD